MYARAELVQLKRSYLFIAHALPSGAAMEKTGASQQIASWLQGAIAGCNQMFILTELSTSRLAKSMLVSFQFESSSPRLNIAQRCSIVSALESIMPPLCPSAPTQPARSHTATGGSGGHASVAREATSNACARNQARQTACRDESDDPADIGRTAL
jgi:hypothetical protein